MTDAIMERLTAIARELEELGTATWRLERERDELRAQLRRALSPPAGESHAAS